MLLRYLTSLWSGLPTEGRRQALLDIPVGIGTGVVGSQIVYVFAILVANEVFHCSVNEKTLVVAGVFIGMVGAMAYESFAYRFFQSRNTQAAVPLLFAALGAVTAGIARQSEVFVAGCVLMGCMQALGGSARTALWHGNYPVLRRGQMATYSLWLSSLAAIGCSALGGLWLDASIGNFRSLFLLFGVVFLGNAYAFMQMPIVPQPETERRHLLRPSKVLRSNPILLHILGAWFLIGFAMHSILVQKTEYLSNPAYGVGLSYAEVAIYASALTEIAQCLAMPFFGWAFDRLPFFLLRVVINTIFIGFMFLYFHSQSLPFIAIGAVLHGLGAGGGKPMWTLWTTKFSSREESGALMSIHMFLTGIRGVLAPWFGYQVIARASIGSLANISIVLQVCSTVWFLWIWQKISFGSGDENSER